MRPLQISPDTAVRLSKALGVPLEQLMHMPHILIQKLVELENKIKTKNNTVLFRRTFIFSIISRMTSLLKSLIGYTVIQFNPRFKTCIVN